MADEGTSAPPTYRQRQAAETRARIAQAARQVFAARGYGAANITDVAQAAGVAVPTVYKLYGNKRGLLAAIADAWGRELGGRILDVPRDPAAAIAWWSGMARRQWEAGLDIGLIYADAVTSEPDARADLEPRLALRERAIRLVSEAVRPRLKDGLHAGRRRCHPLGADDPRGLSRPGSRPRLDAQPLSTVGRARPHRAAAHQPETGQAERHPVMACQPAGSLFERRQHVPPAGGPDHRRAGLPAKRLLSRFLQVRPVPHRHGARSQRSHLGYSPKRG